MEAVIIKTAYDRKTGMKIREEILGKEQIDNNRERQMIEMLLNGFLEDSQRPIE